jgi:myo-inositol 2-dehydrogenase/D-chiro-inositol 1-dehydrogenase
VDERVFGPSFFTDVQTRLLAHQSRELLREATGSDRPEVLTAYLFLISSSIHDAAVLRGVLGRPERVVNAATWAGGTSNTATLAYPNDVRLSYTWSLLPYLKHYEQDYSFFASDGRVHIRFPSPYLRNEPTLVDIEASEGEELRITRVITSYEEAFKLELIHLHDCIVRNERPHTDAEGFRADLEDLTEIARAM